MHLIVTLLGMGLKVGSIDLDARQATLTRYVENRRKRQAQLPGLTVPDHEAVPPTGDEAADLERLHTVVARLAATCDAVVIDTPGSDHYLSRSGHSYANTLVTPLNDSLIDLDVLAKVDPDTLKIVAPSHYSEMVWDTKKQRALRGERLTMDWIVMRNRLSHLNARNKRDMEKLLAELAKRVGCRMIPGLGERVVYRELFLEGLTLLDLRQHAELNLSHVAARQELRNLVEALGLPRLAERAKAANG
jgi:chromosome partitioning protein